MPSLGLIEQILPKLDGVKIGDESQLIEHDAHTPGKTVKKD